MIYFEDKKRVDSCAKNSLFSCSR